jgi:hypothetical protein
LEETEDIVESIEVFLGTNFPSALSIGVLRIEVLNSEGYCLWDRGVVVEFGKLTGAETLRYAPSLETVTGLFFEDAAVDAGRGSRLSPVFSMLKRSSSFSLGDLMGSGIGDRGEPISLESCMKVSVMGVEI